MAGSKSKREMYHEFFHGKLLPKLQEERPNWDWSHGDHQNWVNIHTIKLDLWIGVGFTRKDNLRVDLHIGEDIQRRHPHLYWELYARRPLLEEALGLSLKFTDPSSDDSQTGRVEVDRQGTIEDAQKDSNHIFDWTVLNVISFRSVFTSHLKELLS